MDYNNNSGVQHVPAIVGRYFPLCLDLIGAYVMQERLLVFRRILRARGHNLTPSQEDMVCMVRIFFKAMWGIPDIALVLAPRNIVRWQRGFVERTV